MKKLKRHHTRPELLFEEKAPDEKTEFFLAASHQLKAPVAIIQWCLQSLAEDTKDASARNLIQKAQTQANAMSLLISDMLHVFRIDSHARANSLEPVLLNKVIAESIQQCEPIAQRQKVRLIEGPIENLPPILAEDMYVRQAVINLIDNAIRYSPDGGKVTITAATRPGGFIEVSVADEGIGIPESEQGRLFTEFFRGEEAKETRHDGTGLGLVLVKKIVESFGGSISFKSQLHKGSTFTIRFPYNAA